MADTIDIRFNVTGAEEGAQSVDQLTQSTAQLGSTATTVSGKIGAWLDGLGELTNAEREENRQQREMVRALGEYGQQAQAVTTMTRQLAEAVGASNVARGASLAGAMAGGAAQGAAMGVALGPVGAGLGAVIGGLTPAIAAMSEGINSAALNMDYLSGRARDAVEPLHDVRDAADEVAEAYRRMGEYLDSIDNFVPDWGAGDAFGGPASISDTLRRFGLTGRDRRSGGSGPGVTEFEAEDSQARGFGATDSLDADERAADAEAIIAARDLAIEADQARIESENERHANEIAKREEFYEAEREKADFLREMNEERLADQQAFDEEMAARAETAAEAREQELDGLMQMVGRSSKAIFTAIAQVASGAKSGEEAFLGLLKSFLEMISEYAALKAATEFADAAASFARYDFGGGAAHVGAGLAFTAVAVATGVGAAAIGTGAPQAPARPEAQPDASSGGGNTSYVINWNSPVVTAGTRAELGRDLMGLMSEAEAA